MSAAAAPEVRVRVRMYRQGLGDCFLLSFSAEGATSHVLVDCGVVGRADGAKQMVKVARDVAKATSGRLDLVVATHAHWDHLSGFVDAAAVFGRMRIGEVWLPSTENPGSEGGRAARARRSRLVSRLRSVSRGEGDAGVAGVLGLYGDCAVAGGDAGAVRGQEDEALDFLRDPSRPVRYLDSRDGPLPLPGGSGVTAYVLGPRPLAAPPPAASAEGGADPASAFFSAAERFLGMAEDEETKRVLERNQPFDPSYRLAPGPGETVPCAPERAGKFFGRRYYAPEVAWRRIDTDWLGMARGLALTLENHTNEGSLVLAFELPASRGVLLFPGDARVAPHAWKELGWGGSPPHPTPAELIRRTVLYKVPHHCSQWATPGAALAAMESPDLVALVSVDPAAASALGWRFPHPPLVDELLGKTRGRLLVSTGADPLLPRDPSRYGAGAAEWKTFAGAVKVTPLYVEYSLAG